MSETLYMQFALNIQVDHPDIRLQDIAELASSDEKLLNRCKVFPIVHLPANQEGRFVINVTELVEKLCQKEKNVDFVTTGEPTFLITYQKNRAPRPLLDFLKTAGICLITFFGMAFSIMTFHNDVDIGGLFAQIYEKVMGHPSSGFTVLEISYSIGIGLGVLLFFNHFGKWKLTDDPTPIQVQMQLYEEDLNRTILESRNQKGQ